MMKHSLYILLAIAFSILVFNCLYFLAIFLLVYWKIIPILWVVFFTDITLSPIVFAGVSFFSAISGYLAGKKWWKILYIDKSPRMRRKHA